MTTTPESLRSDLGKVAQGVAATGDATANLRKAAEDRMTEVDARLSAIRSETVTDKPSEAEYLALTEERGTLALVLGEQPSA